MKPSSILGFGVLVIIGVISWCALLWTSIVGPREHAVDLSVSFAEITIRDVVFTVEIARTPKARQRGLQGRSDLPANMGMLFVFEDRAQHTFWMKDTLIPLDMIWIDEGRIVDMTLDVQPPDPHIPDDQLPRYAPNTPVSTVLEIPAGSAELYGFEVGDMVSQREIDRP